MPQQLIEQGVGGIPIPPGNGINQSLLLFDGVSPALPAALDLVDVLADGPLLQPLALLKNQRTAAVPNTDRTGKQLERKMAHSVRRAAGNPAQKRLERVNPAAGNLTALRQILQQILGLHQKHRTGHQSTGQDAAYYDGAGAVGQPRGAGIDVPPPQPLRLPHAAQVQIRAGRRRTRERSQIGALVLWHAALVQRIALGG